MTDFTNYIHNMACVVVPRGPFSNDMFSTICTVACVLCGVAKAIEILSDDGSGEVTCLDNDHVYVLGERMPSRDPCHKECWCAVSGLKRCNEVICEYPACFDSVRKDKDSCCPHCPNGANCKMGDIVLPQGQSIIEMLGHRCSNICTCIYGGHEPTCILQCDDVPPLALLDRPKHRIKSRRLWQPTRKQRNRKWIRRQWFLM